MAVWHSREFTCGDAAGYSPGSQARRDAFEAPSRRPGHKFGCRDLRRGL